MLVETQPSTQVDDSRGPEPDIDEGATPFSIAQSVLRSTAPDGRVAPALADRPGPSPEPVALQALRKRAELDAIRTAGADAVCPALGAAGDAAFVRRTSTAVSPCTYMYGSKI